MLPDLYQEVEYIRFPGGPFIDTGFIPNQSTAVEVKIRNEENGKWVYGIRNSTNPTNTYGVHLSSYIIWYQYLVQGASKGISKDLINKICTIKTDKDKLYLDGVLIETKPATEDFSASNTMLLGNLDQRTSAGNRAPDHRPFIGNIYYCSIWDNDILVRHFVPCYRVHDDVPGFYDIVESVFYENAHTGNLEIGPNIGDTELILPTEIDWTKSMRQHFEYYEVDPSTWKDKRLLTTVKGCNINKEEDSATLGSASIDVNDMLGESYIRVYLVAKQGQLQSKVSMGIFLVQTPTSTFDGKVMTVSMDAYTPLLELNENPVPLGYALLKDENIMQRAYQIIRNYCRAPVVETTDDKTLESDFVANTTDTWLTYVLALVNLAKYKLNLDEVGRILFEPQKKIAELSQVWTYTDDNSSILHPEIALRHDLFGIPNVVEVTADIGTEIYTARVENRDINSPTSIQNRGREITHRDTQPGFPGLPTKAMVDEYAETLLENLSAVEYEISYSHGYCPVRVGDCVRLNYIKAQLKDVKAKVISQGIKCDTGCTVSERAVFTKNLWNR